VVLGWGRDNGAYYTVSWPLLGGVVVGVAGALLLAGLRPSRWTAASSAALVALGLWSLVSVTWGGLPDDSWRTFDQMFIGAAALLTGSMLSRGWRRRNLVLLGVTIGIVLQAGEILYRLQAGSVPSSWFDGRKVQGPVGYANAQAAFLALGIPLALFLASRASLRTRCLGGASAALLLGTLLLTQSRGALVALAVALLFQVAVARDLRLAAFGLLLAGHGALLLPQLRHVDAALVAAAASRPTVFRHYDLWVAAGAVVFGALAAVANPRNRTISHVVVIGTVVCAVGFLGALGATGRIDPGSIHGIIDRGISETNPSTLPGGATRLGSLSLTGRVPLWRVAVRMGREEPLLGFGQGQFARVWGVERDDKNAYVLQPHSIELEVLSQLGSIGFLAFGGFSVLGLAALWRSRTGRRIRGLGVAVLLVLVLQASVDWTFSFPALLVDALLVVGLSVGTGRRRLGSSLTIGLQLAAVLVALAALAGPYLAARRLEAAKAARATDPVEAWRLAASARSADRWSPEVADFQGALAEQAGRYELAARRYQEASELSLQPWVDEFRRARALRRAGRLAASRASCRKARAENPLEFALGSGPCRDVP
jgi:hypothetical protein